MLLQGKIDRAMKWAKERRKRSDAPTQETKEAPLDEDANELPEGLPSMEELRREGKEDVRLEKGDLPAMIFAAMVTILPVCLLVLLVICLVAYLVMFH